MKRLLPHICSILMVSISFLVGSVLTGNNAIAQKIATLTGSGTPGRLARWISNTGLGNSSVSEDKHGNVTLGGTLRFPDGSVQTTASTDAHFQRLTFKLALGQEHEIQLPKVDCPVRVDLSIGNIVIARTGSSPYPEQAVAPIALGKTFSVDALTNMKSSSLVSDLASTGPCMSFSGGDVQCENDVLGVLGNKVTASNLAGSIVVRISPTALGGATIIPRSDFDVCVNMWY